MKSINPLQMYEPYGKVTTLLQCSNADDKLCQAYENVAQKSSHVYKTKDLVQYYESRVSLYYSPMIKCSRWSLHALKKLPGCSVNTSKWNKYLYPGYWVPIIMLSFSAVTTYRLSKPKRTCDIWRRCICRQHNWIFSYPCYT